MKQDKEDRAEGLYSLDRLAPFKRAEVNPVVSSLLQDLDHENGMHCSMWTMCRSEGSPPQSGHVGVKQPYIR